VSPKERRGRRRATVCLVVSMLGSVLFATSFALGGQTQLEGLGLGLAFLGFAGALIVWARDLMPQTKVEDPQHPLASSEQERDDAAARLESGIDDVIGRRAWLVRLAGGAAAFLGIAALFPLRSWGPSPYGRIGFSDWAAGRRLVREDGSVVKVADVEIGTALTVFPEGEVGPDKIQNMADDAVMLVRAEPTAFEMPKDRAGWTPDGFVGYSKVCTHAGCPVALYRAADQQLMCPCHQSTFDVTNGGTVVFGPANRSLPQLPIAIDSDGVLRAAGPLSGFVGPDTWETSR